MSCREVRKSVVRELIADAINSGDNEKQESMLDLLCDWIETNDHDYLAQRCAETIEKLEAVRDALPLQKIEAEERIAADLAQLSSAVEELRVEG